MGTARTTRQLRRQAAAMVALALGLALAAAAPVGASQKVSFKDPKGDDDGPGKYTYPTDPAYKPGSFDMTAFDLKAHGESVDLAVEMAAKLEDPWQTGSGFSVQMVFVFVRVEPTKPPLDRKARREKREAARKKAEAAKEGKEEAGAKEEAESKAAGVGGLGAAGGTEPAAGAEAAPAGTGAKPKPHGFTQGIPGLNVRFAPEDAWDRCIILSPLPAARVKAEVEAKAPALKDAIVVPARVKGSGHTISATIDRKALGPAGDVTDWGYQVVVVSSDAFPAADSLLVRKVNEIESQHRFGGGTDGECGPNVLDVLAEDGEADPAEVPAQHEMLQYECNPDGTASKRATLKMVHVDKDDDEEEPKKPAGPGAPPAPAPPTPPTAPTPPGAVQR